MGFRATVAAALWSHSWFSSEQNFTDDTGKIACKTLAKASVVMVCPALRPESAEGIGQQYASIRLSDLEGGQIQG